MPGRTHAASMSGEVAMVAVTTMPLVSTAASRSSTASKRTPARSMPNWSASLPGSVSTSARARSGLCGLATRTVSMLSKSASVAAIW